jgi:NAD+ kinase
MTDGRRGSLPPIARPALIARLTYPDAVAALAEAAVWLDDHGCRPLIESASAEAARLDGRWPVVARDEMGAAADAIIAFGGDGTLLDAARAVANSAGDAPLIGINLGRLGFLTDVGRGDMISALEALIAGRTRIEERLMIAGTLRREEPPAADMQPRLALNDIVVSRGARSRIVDIEISVDGRFVCRVKADGVIIATATGSTAYNLSAGGPIVHPAVDAFVLTPIAPHTLTQRPIALPATSRISIEPLADSSTDVLVTFDGQIGVPLNAGEVVEIVRASRSLRLIHTTPRTHFDMLREKLKWGNG